MCAACPSTPAPRVHVKTRRANYGHLSALIGTVRWGGRAKQIHICRSHVRDAEGRTRLRVVYPFRHLFSRAKPRDSDARCRISCIFLGSMYEIARCERLGRDTSRCASGAILLCGLCLRCWRCWRSSHWGSMAGDRRVAFPYNRGYHIVKRGGSARLRKTYLVESVGRRASALEPTAWVMRRRASRCGNCERMPFFPVGRSCTVI